MNRCTLTPAQVVTARQLANDGVGLIRIATLLRKPYVDVFAAVRGLDYPHPVMGVYPVPSTVKDVDPWP